MIRVFTGIMMLVLLNINSFCQQKDHIEKNKSATTVSQQEYLKRMVLCECVDRGFKKDSLLFKDGSVALLFELSGYPAWVNHKIDHMVIAFADSISSTNNADQYGKRSILFSCIELYKSRKLSLFINQIDKIILAEEKRRKYN